MFLLISLFDIEVEIFGLFFCFCWLGFFFCLLRLNNLGFFLGFGGFIGFFFLGILLILGDFLILGFLLMSVVINV